MYMQNEIATAVVTGFRFKEPRIDPAKRQAELAAVIALANAGRAGIKRLAEFSISAAREDDDHSYFTQIRAAPVSGFGGCEFRFDMPARSTGERNLQATADKLLHCARAFERLTGVAELTELMRASAAQIIEATSGGTVPMRIVAFGLVMGAGANDVKFVLDVEALGDDLRPGIERIHAWEAAELDGKLEQVVGRHLRRQTARDLAVASRALGLIDETALAILDASGLPREEAFAILRDTLEVEFYFNDEGGCEYGASLFWEDGVIRGSLNPFDNGSTLCGNRLTILNPGLPDTILASWTARRFGAVATHSFIPADALVTKVEIAGEWVYVDVVVATRLIDEGALATRLADRVM